jgi:iron(III) transport system ATP-binding protein
MRKDILHLQRKLGITTIFVTHDQEEANVMSDRVAVLNNGIVEQLGRPEDLYNNPINLFTANFLGTTNTLEGEVVSNNGKLKFISKENIEINNIKFKTGKCKILLRPQNFYINNNEIKDELVKLKGKIVEKEFLGNILRYTINVSEKKILVDLIHEDNSLIYNIEDEIELSFDINKLRFLES